jgi:Holliday junction resolvasome RuvABC endonuclease subunit
VHLGYGVLDLAPTRSRAVAYGVLGDGLPERPADKLDELALRIDRVMNTHCPDVVAYEDQAGVEVAMQRDGEGSNYSSRRLHEVTGMLRFAARCTLDAPLPCYCPQPRTIKVALLGKGYGKAEKKSVQWGVERLFGVRASSHVCDAIATAVCGARMHRLAMAKLRSVATLIR